MAVTAGTQCSSAMSCEHRWLYLLGSRSCLRCGLLWVPGGMRMGPNSVLMTDSYVEFQTGVAPANPSAGFVRQYATGNTTMFMRDSTGTATQL